MMYKVLLLKRKKVQLHDGAELRATVSCKTVQILSLGCGKNYSRFVSSSLKNMCSCVHVKMLKLICHDSG